jgi:hypothetical protein
MDFVRLSTETCARYIGTRTHVPEVAVRSKPDGLAHALSGTGMSR